MKWKQIGDQQIADYSQALLRQLQKVAALFALDTVETEVLTQLASMEMGTRLPNILELRKTLDIGWKESGKTMRSKELDDAIIAGILMADPAVRYAVVVRKPGKPAKTIAYLA